jgi:hypothetical protein
MLPTMKYFSSHKFDFKNNDIYEIQDYIISELNKIPISAKLQDIIISGLINIFLGDMLSFLISQDKWRPMHCPSYEKGIEIEKQNIFAFGPLGMHFFITPTYMTLPEIIFARIDWYSPNNKEKVQEVRNYYHSIIKVFGGDHVTYADERIWQKYFEEDVSLFDQTLISKYGINKKPLFSYPHGKCPRYYIDTFNDLNSNKKILNYSVLNENVLPCAV